MQFIRNHDSVIIEHENIALTFQVSIYGSTKYKSNLAIFNEVNQYLSGLPYNRQRQIFLTYSKLNEIFYSVTVFDAAVNRSIKALVKELYQYLSIMELDMWLRAPGRTQVPPTSTDTISDDLEENRTFLAEDYRNLITYTVALRMMLPIWGEYQMMYCRSTSHTKNKEYVALKLIVESELFLHPSYQRIMVYIQATISAAGGSISATIAGLGSSFLPEYLLAGALVRRLTVAPINVDLERGGLAKNIHGYVQSALKDFDSQDYRVKQTGGGGGGDEPGEDFSHLERLRIKYLLSLGYIEKYGVWLKQSGAYGVARAIDATIPPELVASCLETNHDLVNVELTDAQLILAQWIMYPVLSTKGLSTVNRVLTSTIVMPAVQALLIHWGFPMVALLSVASKREREIGTIYPTSSRPSRNTWNLLSEHFPYTKMDKKNVGQRQGNVAYTAIEDIATKFYKYNWLVDIPKMLLATLPANTHAREEIVPPPDLSEQLSLIVIKSWSNFSEQHLDESRLSKPLR